MVDGTEERYETTVHDKRTGQPVRGCDGNAIAELDTLRERLARAGEAFAPIGGLPVDLEGEWEYGDLERIVIGVATALGEPVPESREAALREELRAYEVAMRSGCPHSKYHDDCVSCRERKARERVAELEGKAKRFAILLLQMGDYEAHEEASAFIDALNQQEDYPADDDLGELEGQELGDPLNQQEGQ